MAQQSHILASHKTKASVMPMLRRVNWHPFEGVTEALLH